MDCDTARLFLPYDRPGGHDLDGPEADELHAHLEQCSACNTLAMNLRRFDQHLGRAMHAVKVPAGLKDRLLERLAEDRGVIRRKWAKRAARAVAVAAGLLLATWGIIAFYARPRNQIDVAEVRAALSIGGAGHLPSGSPSFVNYSYLTGEPSDVGLPGVQGNWLQPEVKAPQLVFIGPRSTQAKKGEEESPKAIVFILPTKRYEILPPPILDDNNYRYKVEMVTGEDADSGYTYIILYNGGNWRDWLKVDSAE